MKTNKLKKPDVLPVKNEIEKQPKCKQNSYSGGLNNKKWSCISSNKAKLIEKNNSSF